MALATDAAIWGFGSSTDLANTTVSVVGNGGISDNTDLVEYTHSDNAAGASFMLEITDYAVAPTAGTSIELRCSLIEVATTNDEPAVDSNYQGHFLGSFIPDAITGAQWLILGPVELPVWKTSQKYQFYIKNNTGQTIGSADDKWTLHVKPITFEPKA